MKRWNEDESIIETEFQALDGEPEIAALDIWQTKVGFYLTLKFRRKVTLPSWNTVVTEQPYRSGKDFFLAVRRKRNGPRIFKDVNRLLNFLGTNIARVEEVTFHLLPAKERPLISTAPVPKVKTRTRKSGGEA